MKRLAWWLAPFPCLVGWAVWSGMAWPISTTLYHCFAQDMATTEPDPIG